MHRAHHRVSQIELARLQQEAKRVKDRAFSLVAELRRMKRTMEAMHGQVCTVSKSIDGLPELGAD